MRNVPSVAVFMLIAAALPVLAADEMRAFPPAEKGMVRHVLQLPKRDNESAFKVELIVGKAVQLDAGTIISSPSP